MPREKLPSAEDPPTNLDIDFSHEDTLEPYDLASHAASMCLSQEYGIAVKVVSKPDFAQQVDLFTKRLAPEYNWADLEDVSQEVALRLLRSPGLFSARPGRTESAAISIATRWVIARRQRDTLHTKKRGSVELVDGTVDRSTEPNTSTFHDNYRPAVEPDFSERVAERIAYRRVLGTLSLHDRQIIELLYYNDLTRESAGKLLDIPKSTVNGRAYQALYHLRVALQQSV